MRKRLLFVTLLLVSQMNFIKAQDLFSMPDTVCIRQPVQITSNVTNAATYYWGFCSGYLLNAPDGNNLGPDPSFNVPNAIEVIKDNGTYYGFVANGVTDELLRLDFGNSLANLPSVTNFGTLTNTMPDSPNKISIVKDIDENWVMFITGGVDVATSSFTRIDFGKSLANEAPNSVNFANLQGLLNIPRGIVVQRQDTAYYGFIVNNGNSKLLRLDFGNNISLTPTVVDLGFGLSQPTDIAMIFEDTAWHLFVINNNNTLARVDLGKSLGNTPSINNMGTLNGNLSSPTSISFIRDCGMEHLLITNYGTDDFVRVDMRNVFDFPYTTTVFNGIGGVAGPTGVSRVIREGDNIYAYITNSLDNSLSQIIFPQCTDATINSSTDPEPPVVIYNDLGDNLPHTYNVILSIDEGLPTHTVECQQIVVLPIPPLVYHSDTVICQGDTIELSIYAIGSLGQTWYPDYNIKEHDTNNATIFVSPEFSFTYNVILPYANGCIVDTPVRVDVSKNKADAGADRPIFDGAKTTLGGPMTSEGVQYTYTWLPDQYISSTIHPNPVANPPFDFTYYLEVRNSFGCYDIDTVVIDVQCNDINLPNVFTPESKNEVSRKFGVLNNQIVKLNHLRVFDRWGKMLFETTDVTKQWDGRYNGELVPYGVYVWEADGFCNGGQRFRRSGNVTLLR